MRIVYYNFIIIFVGILAQILIWNIKKPKLTSRSIFFIFSLCNLIAFAFLFDLNNMDLLYSFIFQIFFILSYILLFTAIEIPSPTFTILLYIKEKNSVSPEELTRLFDKNAFVETKINDLVVGNLISIQGNKIISTSKCRNAIFPFVFLRKLFGIKRFGG